MRIATLLSVALLCATSLVAQEKPAPAPESKTEQLPAPGTWVKYLVSQEGSEANATLTVRMLDLVIEENERFRRVEFDWFVRATGENSRDVSQYLLSEKAMLTDESPFFSLKQIRTASLSGTRLGEEPIPELEVSIRQATADDRAAFNSFGWGLLFPGERKGQTAKADEREIEYQHGKLLSRQSLSVRKTRDLTGTTSVAEGVEKLIQEHKFNVWLTPKVPFGVASLEYRQTYLAYNRDGKKLGEDPMPLMTWTVNDFGTGAKSALPARD